MNGALVVRAPGTIAIEERRKPDPNPEQVVVQVSFAAICHTDHFLLDGRHPAVSYPIVPGHEVSGVVESVGELVDGIAEGDHVSVVTQIGCSHCEACGRGEVSRCPFVVDLGSTADGGWQATLLLPSRALRVVPAQLSLEAAALTEPAANAHALVRQARIQPNDVVVVLGPGPIGLLSLQYALLRKPKLTLVAGLEHDEARLALARRMGANEVISARPEQLADTISRALAGRDPTVILQCAPSIAATRTALAISRRRSRVLIEGYAGDEQTISLNPDLLAAEERVVQGVRGWNIYDFDAALDINASGLVDIESLISGRYALAGYEAALAASLDYGSGAMRVLFDLATVGRPEETMAAGATAY
jgi:L-iditol 2-dehydrogenase